MTGKTVANGAFALVLAGFASAAAAQAPAPAWGISGHSQYVVTAWDMQAADSSTTWAMAASGQRYRTGPSGEFVGAVHVPQGALIEQISLRACDSSVEGQVAFLFYRQSIFGLLPLASVGTGATETPNCDEFNDILPFPETVDNSTYRYILVGGNDTADGQTTFASIHVVYRLQVSSPPASARFNDVPVSDPAFQFIEALASSGITAGCGGGNFCPDGFLTRRQMAVFLAKALGLFWPEGTTN
jgi:S-layer homology domain